MIVYEEELGESSIISPLQCLGKKPTSSKKPCLSEVEDFNVYDNDSFDVEEF